MLKEIPNIISIIRIILIVPIVYLLMAGKFQYALALFVIAGISDALDGYLAKRFNWFSHLGSILDPLADKLLLVSCYIVLGWMVLIPAWLVAVVIIRDVVIVVGSIVYHYKIEHFQAAPSIASKLNTFMQIVLVIVVIVDRAIWKFSPLLIESLVYIVLLTTVISGYGYIKVWGLRAINNNKQEQ